jgi:two-component system, OmpR family, response regulator
MSQDALIAVVEDDPEIRALVGGLLNREGFEAVACNGGRDLDRLMEKRRVDLIVLDLMLEGEDGLSICRRVRGGPADTPVLMVTARGDDIDRIVGLEIGADDYLAKPFNPRELVARVRAILRRTCDQHRRTELTAAATYHFSGWTVKPGARQLFDPDGRAVELTGAEFDLLMAFVTRAQRILNRDQLLDWTRGRRAAPIDRTIDVQLSRLRRKLGDDPREPAIIRTVRGGGYLFAPAVKLSLNGT